MMHQTKDLIDNQILLDLDILGTLSNLFGPAGNEPPGAGQSAS